MIHARSWLLLCALVVGLCSCSPLDDIIQSLGDLPTVPVTDQRFDNLLAKQSVLDRLGFTDLNYDSKYEGIPGQVCMRATRAISKHQQIFSVANGYLLTIDDVWQRSPKLKAAIKDVGMEEVLEMPTIVYSLYLWSQRDSVSSLHLSWLSMVKKMAYHRDCENEFSHICPPHLWSQTNRRLLFPSPVRETVESEIEWIHETYDQFAEQLFPLLGWKESRGAEYGRNVWLQLFLTVRALTFIRPFDQAFVLNVPMVSIPHSLEPTAMPVWQEEGLHFISLQPFEFATPLTINYWELLGSVGTLIDEADLAENGIDPEIYEIRRNAIQNSASLLMEFGQLPMSNENHTHVMIRVKLSFDDVVVERLLADQISTIDFVDSDRIAEIRVQPGVFPEAFMALARMVSLSLDEMAPDVLTRVAAGEFISLTNESKATKKTVDLLNHHLDSYATPIEMIRELWSVPRTKRGLQGEHRLRLHYNEQMTLTTARDRAIAHWNQILSKALDTEE